MANENHYFEPKMRHLPMQDEKISEVYLKVPFPSSSLISRLTVKVKISLSGVRGGACVKYGALLADRRKAVAKL